MSEKNDDYLLGVNQAELERLQYQHQVWKNVTDNFLDRLHIQKGWKCLDVGAGPGFVSLDLHDRVGEEGEITALEPSEYFLAWLKSQSEQRGWKNIARINGSVEQAELPKEYFDFIFVRWVIAFVPDPVLFFEKLVHSLKPGAVIAFQDYYYEGLSLHPKGGVWDSMADTVRAYYRSAGGDPYIAGKLPEYFHERELTLIDFSPHQLAGGPSSEPMEWAHRFFITHTQIMADKGIITQEQCDAYMHDWMLHRANPLAIFFTPVVVDVAGRKRNVEKISLESRNVHE